MKIRSLPLLLLLLVGHAHASGGEIGWASVSFCDAAEYCVDAKSKNTEHLDSLSIRYKDKPVALPASVLAGVPQAARPVLQEARLFIYRRGDGVFESRLEIPMFELKENDENVNSVFYVVFADDEYIKSGIAEKSFDPPMDKCDAE